jgi:hypothetical protein
VVLFAFTGKSVIGVFQTLSAGNAAHCVPGNTVPEDWAEAGESATPSPITAIPVTTKPATTFLKGFRTASVTTPETLIVHNQTER